MSKLFEEQIARKPDYYPWTQDFIKAMWFGHWTPDEFNFKSDLHDFKVVLTEQEQQVVTRTLSAIGQIEVAVKKFWSRLGDNLPHPSLTDMGLVMANIEVIHNIAYEKLLTVLNLHGEFEKNLKEDVILGRVKYLRKYLDKQYQDNKKQYIYALILFTLFVEGVSLFSQFYIVLWFGRYRNLLKDTNQQVHYTFKEEIIHSEIGIKLINTLREEYPELFDEDLINRIKSEAIEAYLAESKIIDWILEGYTGIRLSGDVLKEYVKYRLNFCLESIGIKGIYDINSEYQRDFEWVNEETLGNLATDFFHRRPTEYAKKSQVINAEELFDDGT
jgi:ribonucleoside-diphosphate reductase beta chain